MALIAVGCRLVPIGDLRRTAGIDSHRSAARSRGGRDHEDGKHFELHGIVFHF
jgi:hypothetical protein